MTKKGKQQQTQKQRQQQQQIRGSFAVLRMTTQREAAKAGSRLVLMAC
jgi:hypothetical protein